MNSMLHKYILLVSLTLFIIATFLLVSQTFAVNRPPLPPQAGVANTVDAARIPTITTTPSVPPVTQINRITTAPTNRTQSFAQIRLQGAKLRACQALSSNIVARSTHLVNLVKQMEETFTAIAKRVEQYYLSIAVPSGATLTNYDALVANIVTKENTVNPLLAAAQSVASNFSCDNNNPSAQLTQYRTNMQAVVKELEDYRTAIKNLIVAVRTLPIKEVTPTMAATQSAGTEPTATTTPIIIQSVTP